MSKPKATTRKPLARKRSGAPAGLPIWLPVALVAGVAVVAVILLAGRPSGQSAQSAGGTRAVGQAAPPVRLAATNGQTVDVAGFRGKRNVLLYFYEHAG